MRKPDFFIVGAPKCGTTALNDYLAGHPEIFMAQKEIHYFGSDLGLTQAPMTESEYVEYFSEGKEKKLWGESSVWYLYSKNAAREIKSFAPDARIIIMLREPASMLYSLHAQHLFDGNEDRRDFKKAISLDSERKRGKSLPRSRDFKQLPSYLETARYTEQVKRFLDSFGRERVRILLFEELKTNPEKTFSELLEFLNVSPWRPERFDLINSRKKYRSYSFHRLFKTPGPLFRSMIRLAIPFRKFRSALSDRIYDWNLSEGSGKKMDEETKNFLRSEFREENLSLSQLIQKDLKAWIDD